MRKFKAASNYILIAILSFLFAESALGYQKTPSGPLLPADLVIEGIFKPGTGIPVGRVLLVQGDVVIMHVDKTRGYRAERNSPLFKGDTLVTREKGRIRFTLNDDSIMTMASRSKLVLSQSVFEPKKKSRFSFLKMDTGKVRFFVKKMLNFRRSEFKVRTPTTVIGVRGSDFIVVATEMRTSITALEETILELVSTAALDAPPVLIKDFERAIVEEGKLPSDVIKVSPEEIKEMINEIAISIDRVEPAGKIDLQKGGEAGKGKPEGEKKILAPEKDLLGPEETDALKKPLPADMIEKEKMSEQMDKILEQREEILREQYEDESIQELPHFPETPE